MRLNPFAPTDNPLYESLYCFGGGDEGGGAGGSAGDFEGTNFGGDTATAGGNLSGRGGSQDNDRRVDSSGNTTNFNIDRSQPSVTGTVNGQTTTMYGTQANLDKAIAGGDISVTPSPSDTYTPSTQKAAEAFSSASQSSPFMPSPSQAPALANIPEFDEPAGAISMYGIPGVTPPGSYTPTSITQAARGPTDYEAEAYGAFAAPARETIQGTRTDVPDALKTAAARGRVAEKGIDVTGKGSEGTREVDTIFDPSEFNLGIPDPRTEAERQAAFAALRGSPLAQQVQEARSSALGSADTTTRRTNEELALTGSFALPEAKAMINESISAGQGTPSTAQGLASMPGYTGPNAMQQGMANITAMNNLSAQAAAERPFTPIEDITIGGVQIPSLLTAGVNVVGDIVNTLDMYGGGNMPAYMENVAQRPAGTPVMSQGPMMSYTPESLQPTPLQQAMMEGSDGQPLGPYSPAEGSQEVIGAVGPNKLGFLPGQSDLIYVGSQKGYETLGGDDSGIEYVQPGGGGGGDQPSDDGGGDQTTMPQEVAPVAPKTCPDGYTYDEASDSCVYQGVARVQPYQYTPSTGTPYQYTGLPSLAPVSLKPSFQASGQYAPLFPMNFGS